MTTFALTSIFILLYGTDLGLHVPPEGGEVGAGWIQEGGVPDHLGQEALPVLFDPDHIGCTDARGSGTYQKKGTHHIQLPCTVPVIQSNTFCFKYLGFH